MAKEKKAKKNKDEVENIKNDISIEESFASLDDIIEQMENENCSIEKSLELYEKGVKLIGIVNKKVSKIEKDLKIIGKSK